MNPRGSWAITSERKMNTPSRASDALNLRIGVGIAGTRPGRSRVATSTGQVTSLFNWIAPNGNNYVLMQDGRIIKSLLQGGATTDLFMTPDATRSTSFADLDVWTYFVGYDTSSMGTHQVQVYDGVDVDTAFRAAVVLTAATAVDGGVGLCTQGTRFIGFVYTNRDGFTTQPSLTVSGVQIPATTNAGLRQINITVTLPALLDGGPNVNGNIQAQLSLIATTTQNPAQYFFVPAENGTTSVVTQNVPFNAPVTLNFIMSFSDEDLDGSSVPVNGPKAKPNLFLLLTQDAMGNGPFNPSFVVAYGTRMVYGVGTSLYVSDPSAPQQITGDQNVLRLPNQRQLGYAFPLPGSNSLYVTGGNFTAYYTDNTDVPGTWAQPVFVSGPLGSPFPCNVCFKTAGPYVWMATERGIELFAGQFQQKPLTFLISGLDASRQPVGWNRVNWKAAYCVQIADDVTNQKCYVSAALDGATEPNAQFVIDYQNSPDNGISFDNVDITIDTYNPAIFGAIGVVKELATAETNLWIGPNVAGDILHFDPSVPCEVQSYWESGLVRGVGEIQSAMIRVGQLDIWVRGSDGATLNITVFGPDREVSVTPELMSTMGVFATLKPKPGLMYMARFDLNLVENYTVRMGCAAGQAFELSGFMAYARPSIYNR